jgi:Glycosyl transferases group 1
MQRVVISASGTTPLAVRGGFFDRQKLKAAARAAAKADKVVFSSEAAAAAHRRIGFLEQGHAVIPPGVDPSRFRQDAAARRRVREQLSVPPDAFVIGMMAPFQADYDHATLLKGLGELIKAQPKIHVLLAGHGVQKGNAPLMALLGGNLATRTHLLGEWSDVAGFFNACDAAVSTALTDAGRMTLVMAMLCAVPCVATGVGEQGEAIGQCSLAIEQGSPAAVVRGITRVIEMPPERRTFLAQSARKHALKHFSQICSLQHYVQLYHDVLGREVKIEELLPTPAEIEGPIAPLHAVRPSIVKTAIEPPSDPDSLETASKEVIQWQPMPRPVAPADPQITQERTVSDVDVLEIFESARSSVAESAAAPTSQGKVEEVEDLLAPELLAANAGEEFRPQQVAAAKSKAVASARRGAADGMVRPLRPSSPGTTPAQPTLRASSTVLTQPAISPAPAQRSAPAAPAANSTVGIDLDDLDDPDTVQLDSQSDETHCSPKASD